MVTTNLPQLVHELHLLGAVRIKDHMDTIELHVAKPIDLHEVDDLLCDALFVDPMDRREDAHAWTIQLYKRDHLRGASDMAVKKVDDRSVYLLQPAA